MTVDALRVVSPGPLSTIQDLGRPGYQRFGVSVSGAADRYALRLGNLLVGNDERGAAIEVTIGGAEFEFTSPAIFAITGADLSPTLNGTSIALWETVSAAAGDRLSLMSPAGPDSGLRAYLSVSGGFDAPPVLGSRSTHIGARLGGIEGRVLEPDDGIPTGPVTNAVRPGRRVPQDLLPQYGGDIVARVVPGPQDDLFDSDATATFYNSAYTVSDKSDRVGSRLEGPQVPAIDGAHDIISDGVLSGAIQIPGDAQPIILLADRQTTGGYAKIGVIASVDLALVAQASPGATVRFERISAEDASALARDRIATLRDISFDGPASGTVQGNDLRREYDLQIDGSGYRVEITSGVDGGQTIARVNGVEYVVHVHPGE
ncbi:MAG TPA: biotin-dependent carboxyltransferase [Dehalococcoidia bacterium]|jgi:antagonist of KipI|nr:biotin-dependent carboxyltransferase [Dehalococcoidia bacterium]